MNKKGFTLIELLAVIVILALLALITGTAVTKLISDSKEDLSNVQIQLIKSAAESWTADNIMDVPDAGECVYLTLKDLKEFGFIDSKVTNPKTNKEFSDDLKIKISSTLSEYNATVTTFEVDPTSVQGCRHFEQEPGLYDSNGNLLASWYELTQKYGLNIENDYSIEDTDNGIGSFDDILKNNENLSTGTKLIISPDVKKIGSRALYNCISLKSIIILDGLTEIGNFAFAGCTSLENIKIPSSVTTIGAYVFSRCTSLESITLPSGIKKIDLSAFSQCSNLKNIILPSNLEIIDTGAFNECTSLESITIPSSVTSIEYRAFKGCSNLKTIYYSGTASDAPWGAESATIVSSSNN